MRELQRNLVQARAARAQAECRPLDGMAQPVATPPGLHYTAGVVQRTAAAATTPVVQRAPKRLRPASFASDHSEEDELQTISGPVDHEYIGLVSWNVQHFSDHNLMNTVELLQRQLDAFDLKKWQALFTEFSHFRNRLGKALKAQYARGTFAGLQEVSHRLRIIGEGLDEYDAFLQAFDIEAFAERIEALQSTEWQAEIKQSDSDRVERVALLERVGQFKHVVKSIDQAEKGLKKMTAVLGYRSIFERMDKALPNEHATSDLARSAAGLLVKLSAVLNSIVNRSTLDTFRKALHSHNIAIHIDEMFAQNDDWLDVIILQEINNPGLLDDDDAGYTMHRGTHMKSGGRNGQNEYYPLLIRKDSGVTVEQEYLVTTAGEMKKVADGEFYSWQKKKSVYRPIMAYVVSKKNGSKTQRYLIGVVHTTPEVDGGLAEFNRRAIYGEVARGLATLKQWADDEKLPLIVGGDYYLSAEAVVHDPTAGDLALLDPAIEDDEEFDDPDVGELLGIRQSIDQLIKGLRSLKPATKEEGILIDKRLKVLEAAMSDAQILRNICKLTMQAQVERLGLYLDQTLSGTNPKANPLTHWFDLQIADFFIRNDAITASRVGIMLPEGGMVPLDREDLHYSRYWQNFSDHFPVGGIYGVGGQGIPHELGRRGQYSDEAAEEARLLNLRRFAFMALSDKGKRPHLGGLTQEQLTTLALEKLRAQIERIDPGVPIPDSFEGCVALMRQLQAEKPDAVTRSGGLLVFDATEFEPNYLPPRSPRLKRRRLLDDEPDLDADTGSDMLWQASLPEVSSSRGDTIAHGRSDVDRQDWVANKKRAPASLPLIQPVPSAARVSQAAQRAFLDRISPDWNKEFANVPGTSAPPGPNQGYMAGEVASAHQALAMPNSLPAQTEREWLAGHGLMPSENSGAGALCFVYSVLMGLTGESEQEVRPMVDYIAQEAAIPEGWIGADSAEATRVIGLINHIYDVDLNVVVVSLATGLEHGAIISARGGRLGDGTDTVLIRQTAFHYDAYVPWVEEENDTEL